MFSSPLASSGLKKSWQPHLQAWRLQAIMLPATTLGKGNPSGAKNVRYVLPRDVETQVAQRIPNQAKKYESCRPRRMVATNVLDHTTACI